MKSLWIKVSVLYYVAMFPYLRDEGCVKAYNKIAFKYLGR